MMSETGTRFHDVPPDQLLTPLRVWEHSITPIKIVMAACAIGVIVAFAAWAWRLTRPRTADGVDEAVVRLLTTIALAAPLFGLAAAAWNILKVCLGSVNDLPTPTVTELMPAFAEATQAMFLAFAAAAISVLLRGHLQVRAAASAPDRARPTKP